VSGAKDALVVTFLDVGQGDATIITLPEGQGDPIVFDCRDGWVVRQQLRAWGVRRLHAVIASHLDLDHIGGMADLLAEFRHNVGQVYWAWDRPIDDDSIGAKAAKAVTDTVREGDKAGDWPMVLAQRDARPIARAEDASWSVDLLAPRGSLVAEQARTGKWDDANCYSAVLRVRMGNTALLIGADAPLVTWAELPERELPAKVFRVPHHGGALDDGGVPDSWSAERLYTDVAPEFAAISVGTNNDHGHPDFGAWAKPLVKRQDCRLLCTQVTGACHKPLEKTKPQADVARLTTIAQLRKQWLPDPANGVSHFAEPAWRHFVHDDTRRRDVKRFEVPCAGTISVKIEPDGKVTIDPTPENVSLAGRIAGWSRPTCS
jgi:beta-lactamase superfamily II metal-dependent hydrolase